MHVRVMLVIRWFFAAHFVDDAGPQILLSRGLSIAIVGASRHISLQGTAGMGKHTGKWVARQLPCRCFENEPSAVYAARFGGDAGLRIRTHGLNTANVGSFP